MKDNIRKKKEERRKKKEERRKTRRNIRKRCDIVDSEKRWWK